MKVYIGNFRGINIDGKIDHLFFKIFKIFIFEEEKFTKRHRLVYNIFNVVSSICKPIDRFIDNFPRTIRVKVDDYDLFSLDHTLSLVILPCLEKYKEHLEQGYFFVDEKDLPKELRTGKTRYENPDSEVIKCKWIIDEMIYAFRTVSIDDENLYDREVQARVERGLQLFGKYYRSLWT